MNSAKKLAGALLLLILLAVGVAPAAYAQQMSVSGTVTDTSGEPLIGASVVIKGQQAGATTDIDGNFSIEAPSNAVLQISYVGFKTKDVNIDGRRMISVTLEENTEVLNEVVVIGYGTMDKKELTSAISHVSEKDFLR